MSATAAAPATTTATEGIPFSRLLKVEFRKAYDTRAGLWLLIVMGALVAIAEVITIIVVISQDTEGIMWGSFATVAGTITNILLPVLGIMLVTTEWTQRTAMVTFTVESRRSRVIFAKLVVGLLLTVSTVIFSMAVGAVCNAIYGISGGDTVWWDKDFTYGLSGFAINQALSMLIGFAFAALMLNTAAAIVTYFAYSFVLPGLIFLGANTMDWFADIAPWFNFAEASGKVYEMNTMTGEEWAHFVVAALIWVVLPLGIGLRRILRAEVK